MVLVAAAKPAVGTQQLRPRRQNPARPYTPCGVASLETGEHPDHQLDNRPVMMSNNINRKPPLPYSSDPAAMHQHAVLHGPLRATCLVNCQTEVPYCRPAVRHSCHTAVWVLPTSAAPSHLPHAYVRLETRSTEGPYRKNGLDMPKPEHRANSRGKQSCTSPQTQRRKNASCCDHNKPWLLLLALRQVHVKGQASTAHPNKAPAVGQTQHLLGTLLFGSHSSTQHRPATKQ